VAALALPSGCVRFWCLCMGLPGVQLSQPHPLLDLAVALPCARGLLGDPDLPGIWPVPCACTFLHDDVSAPAPALKGAIMTPNELFYRVQSWISRIITFPSLRSPASGGGPDHTVGDGVCAGPVHCCQTAHRAPRSGAAMDRRCEAQPSAAHASAVLHSAWPVSGSRFVKSARLWKCRRLLKSQKSAKIVPISRSRNSGVPPSANTPSWRISLSIYPASFDSLN
jgi:hypothetical protein